jgi:hypothetical protein
MILMGGELLAICVESIHLLPEHTTVVASTEPVL